MNKATKRLLITTLSAVTLTCGTIGWAINPEKQEVASAETSKAAISLVDGASCRIRTASDEEKGSGIRFKAVLDRTQWTALAESNEMIAGIMILPTDYIAAAGGYTHSALDTAGKNYLDFTYTEDEVGEKTVLAASMVDILDQNYTRDFSGVAYLKSETAFEGATEYNGAYYLYAEYTEEDNSRSIYEIAFAAYNDRSTSKVTTDYENTVIFNESTSYSPYTDEQREVLKNYLDGVVDIKKNAYAEVFVANNTEYYTSPYTVEKKSDSEFIVDYDFSVKPKSMLYKGNRIKSLSVKEGKTSISITDRVVFSANTDKNYDGTVTMPARQTGGGNAILTIASMDADYIAFEGNYGIGTYVDFTFTGNNMPQVMFFADEINGNMTNTGGTGVICMNGLTMYEGSGSFSRYEDYLVFGPNRINATASQTGYDHGQQIALVTNGNASTSVDGDYPLLSQWKLRDTPDTKYAYTVGTYEGADGYLYIDIYLSYADTDELIYHIQQKTSLKVSNMTVKSGNIVAYTCWKGSYSTETTTFGYGMPYSIAELTIPNSGAKLNLDGSVTLKGGSVANTGWMSGAQKILTDLGYIAFEGEYGIGTYMDFAFKGNNMPMVTFFADYINNNFTTGVTASNTAAGNKGMLIMNGLYTTNYTPNVQFDYLSIWGPTRYYGLGNADTNGSATVDKAFAYGQTKLDADMTYLYTVGTYETSDGYVGVHVVLKDGSDTVLYDNQIKTHVKASAITADNIIVFSGITGATNTTFSYSEPYTVEELTIPNSGATVNPDGTITVKGIRPTHAGYGSGVGPTGTKSSYVAFEGSYGVGTYIDVDFTGNNMPYIMLFADSINGYFGSNTTTDKGIVITNGIVSAGNSTASTAVDTSIKTNIMQIWGPNRYKGNGTGDAQNYPNELLATITDCAALTQDGLNGAYSSTKLRYTVGTYTDGTYVGVHISLYNRDTNQRIYDNTFLTNIKVSDISAGHIVLFASAKGLNKNTTFSYSEPYQSQPLHRGATFNEDGTVTLAAGTTATGNRNGLFAGAGWASGASEYKNNYITYNGDYGVGTCVEYTFTGNNMPQVMLFANQINDSMGCGNESYGYKGSTGYLITNGLVAQHSGVKTAWYANFLYCFGPNRISEGTPLTGATKTNFMFESGKEYTALDSNTEYKYVVWSEVNASGTVDIRVQLINTSDESVVVDGTYATGKTQSGIEANGGKIVAYAGVKGEVGVEVGTETTHKKVEGNTTTFAYSQPYTKEQEEEEETVGDTVLSGATVNADGSVTLSGKESYSAGWSSGVHVMDNSFIAYNGEYILGTEVAFTFKGNNLPQVMLFADEINGDMSKLGGRGILLMNGLYCTNKPVEVDSYYLGENKLVCFGPNRLHDNYFTLVIQNHNCDVHYQSGYEWVELDENTNYKYVVWTEEVSGKIVVCVELYDAVTSVLLSQGSYTTSVGVNDIAAGAIVAYAAVKGDGNDTTFFCHEPKMHEDSMSFYTYGAPGTYDTATDLTTEAVLTDYVASGMNTMVLGGNNAYSGKNWATSKTKAVMATARAAGVEKFIINDSRMYNALCITGGLIGEGCKFASEAELDHYVANCILDYVNEEGFYGVILRDEPSYEYATSIGQLYRSIKRVAETLNTEIYVLLNLLPMASNAQEQYKATPTDSLYNDYVAYLNLFLSKTGADTISVDKYPFVSGESANNYYSTYKALATACSSYGAEFGFVLQSWTYTTAETVSQGKMNLQMNAALAFGAKDIAFYTYVPSDGGENNSSSFVDINGNKTAVYTYAQNAISDAKAMEKLLADYEYVGVSMNNKSQDGEFVDDTFEKLTYTATAWTVITESRNYMTGSYLYTVVGVKASTVTMTFTGYTQVYVVVNGEGSVQNLVNGVYTADLALGEAVYIIPLA